MTDLRTEVKAAIQGLQHRDNHAALMQAVESAIAIVERDAFERAAQAGYRAIIDKVYAGPGAANKVMTAIRSLSPKSEGEG